MPQIASFVVTGFFAIALVGSPETAVAQGQNLPPCPGNPNLVWDDCFGTYLYANGNKYVGEWRDNARHGLGTYSFHNGDKYVGEWRDDKRNGQGTYTFPNGGEYVGEFRDNMRTGQSTFTYADGDTYVGEFRLGFRHGEGTLMSANGTVIRQGLWLNGDPVNGE